MRTLIVTEAGQEQAIAEAVSVLRSGGCVLHATETCYGLACDLTNPQAVARLFAVKERPLGQPVSVLFPSVAAAAQYVVFVPEHLAMAQTCLPGPTTLILPLRAGAPHTLHITADGQPATAAGVRVSSLPLAQALAEAYGRPLSTTSANRHSLPPCYSLQQATEQWPDTSSVAPDFCLDSGELPLRPPSTVLDCLHGGNRLR